MKRALLLRGASLRSSPVTLEETTGLLRSARNDGSMAITGHLILK
jgi:hypothetical protein